MEEAHRTHGWSTIESGLVASALSHTPHCLSQLCSAVLQVPSDACTVFILSSRKIYKYQVQCILLFCAFTNLILEMHGVYLYTWVERGRKKMQTKCDSCVSNRYADHWPASVFRNSQIAVLMIWVYKMLKIIIIVGSQVVISELSVKNNIINSL